MADLRTVWQDIRKNCRENEKCETCKYKDYNPEVCAIRRITGKEILRIENMFLEEGEE